MFKQLIRILGDISNLAPLIYIRLKNSCKTSQAFMSLYDYYPSVKKLILTNGGNNDDAKDVYQEALIIVCKKIRNTNFTLTSSLNTYLYSVCNYIWKDELKKRKKFQSIESLPALETSIELDLEQTLENEKICKLAEQSLLTLGNRCREILKLFYFDSWSMEKISKKFNYKSEKTARNQKYKCLEAARIKLDEYKKNGGL